MSLLVTGITAAAGLAGQGVNAYSQGKMNKRAERFSREMYKNQRFDALSDWHMQNAYNDPSAQMARLKAAGLNPNLVYGNGADAQAQSAPRSSQANQPNFKAPQVDLGGVAFNALQAKQLQANIARTEAETDLVNTRVTEQDYKNKFYTPTMFMTEYRNRLQQADMKTLGMEKGLTSQDIANDRNFIMQQTEAIIAGIDPNKRNMATDKEFKYDGKKNLTVKKLTQAVANMAKQYDGMELDNKLKEFEVNLIKSLGVNATLASQLMSNLFKLLLLRR